MTYLFDNNISPRFAGMLRELGVDAKALRDVFPPNVKDSAFLPQLKGSGWVLVTGDTRIATRPAEAAALKDSGITAIFLGPFWSKMTFWLQARWLVTRWQDIDAYAQSAPSGTCAVFRQRGAPRTIVIGK